jgi:hypothetical protein
VKVTSALAGRRPSIPADARWVDVGQQLYACHFIDVPGPHPVLDARTEDDDAVGVGLGAPAGLVVEVLAVLPRSVEHRHQRHVVAGDDVRMVGDVDHVPARVTVDHHDATVGADDKRCTCCIVRQVTLTPADSAGACRHEPWR